MRQLWSAGKTLLQAHGALLVPVAASLLVWCGVELFVVPWPYADLSRGAYSDHFSHMNQARYFARVGLQKWTKPISASFPRVSVERWHGLPEDLRLVTKSNAEVYEVDGFPPDKPLVSGWSSLPHQYPPGDFLVVLPATLLYHFTGLGFAGACKLLVVIFLVFAHAAVLLLLLSWRAGATSFLSVLFAGGALVFFALEGFYDASYVAFLVGAGLALTHRRPIAAAVLYCAGAFIHFRAYFSGPLFLLAVAGAWQQPELRRVRAWPWQRWAWLGLAAALGVASLVTFVLAWDAVVGRPPNHPFFRLAGQPTSPMQAAGWCLALGTAAGFALARSPWDALQACWVALMLSLTPALWEWYCLALVPWLAMPLPADISPARREVVRDLRLFAVLSWAAVLMRTPLFSWFWQGAFRP